MSDAPGSDTAAAVGVTWVTGASGGGSGGGGGGGGGGPGVSAPPSTAAVAGTPWGEEDPWRASAASVALQALTLSLMWLLGVLGNTLVCVVIHRSRRLQSTTNSFVVSLAVTDLLLCLLVMPPVLAEVLAGRWALGAALCKLVRFMQWLVPAASMLVLSCICVDRFYSIIYPLSFKITRGRAKRMILAAWTTSLLLACPAFYFHALEWRRDAPEAEAGPHCATFITQEDGGAAGAVAYVILISAVTYFVPILVDIGGYLRIFKFIWRAGVGGRTFQRTMNPVPRAKVKMVKMMMVVAFISVALFAPFFIVQLWHCSIRTLVDPHIYSAALWLYFATAVSKPGAYMCFNSNFRRGCKEVFCMSTMKCYRSHAYTITTASKLGKKNHVGVIIEPSLQRESDYQRIESPARHFEHALVMEKNSWPAANSMPSTYL